MMQSRKWTGNIIGMVIMLAILAWATLAPQMANAATKSWVVIGDSIMHGAVPQGTSKQHALALVTQERDVTFKNLSSPGAALGSTDSTGFNQADIAVTLQRLNGYWGAMDGIIIQAATNDWGRNISYGATYASAERIMAWAQTNGKKVMVLDAIWRAGEGTTNAAGNTLNTYRYFLSYLCLNDYATICHMAHRENTVMGTSAGSAYYDSAEVAAGNQTHPNVTGHRKIADWIKAEAATAGFF